MWLSGKELFAGFFFLLLLLLLSLSVFSSPVSDAPRNPRLVLLPTPTRALTYTVLTVESESQFPLVHYGLYNCG